jgi:hypothetical protein
MIGFVFPKIILMLSVEESRTGGRKIGQQVLSMTQAMTTWNLVVVMEQKRVYMRAIKE